MIFRFWILDFGLIPLVAICSCQSAICPVRAADEPSGPRLTLAMQLAPTTAPALPAPPPEADCDRGEPSPPELNCAATLAAPATAQTLTPPPPAPMSGTLLRWGRAERRAERRRSQQHFLRRLLSAPGRVILTPYTHPVARD